jgi:magnesium chelatase subunit D
MTASAVADAQAPAGGEARHPARIGPRLDNATRMTRSGMPLHPDAGVAIALLAAAPPGLGGLLLRGRTGPAQSAMLTALEGTAGRPARLPACPPADLFAGGADALASMAAGRRIERASPLAAGGLWLLPMAERLDPAAAAGIARALDADATLRLVALDEGAEPGEHCPDGLADRLGLWLDLDGPVPPAFDSADNDAVSEEDALAALARAGERLGVVEPRALRVALVAARALAALAGRPLAMADLAAAMRLVLAPRARAVPSPADQPPADPPPTGGDQSAAAADGPSDLDALTDLLVESARAVLPAWPSAGPAARLRRPQPGAGSRGMGARCPSARTGRPRGTRLGQPRGGARLALAETLRAAAPWQPLRGAEPGGRPRLRPDDLRLRRFEARTRTTTILVIDASGSAALERLAEAKGAALLLLADAYVERAAVAVIAVRGEKARVLLPPTRSLARARRELGALPGGGGTPLASALALALRLALAEQARGHTPAIVALTDGRGNVALDPGAGREAARTDALAMARAIAAHDLRALVIDIARGTRGEAAALAAAMRAGFAALPRADAAAVSALARSALAGTGR